MEAEHGRKEKDAYECKITVQKKCIHVYLRERDMLLSLAQTACACVSNTDGEYAHLMIYKGNIVILFSTFEQY